MTLLEQKMDLLIKIFHGEEVHILDIEKVFSKCSVYKSSVNIGVNTIAVIDIERSSDNYRTMIFFKDKLPVVTKESSTDLLLRYRKKNKRNYYLSKRIIKAIFEKSYYLHPYIEKNVMFIPLEGESKGNVSYLNLMSIDSVVSHNEYESVISFSNDLDMIVPRTITCAKNKLKTYLMHYIGFTYSLACFQHQEDKYEAFSHWEGVCYEGYEYLTLEVIKKIDKNVINECRVKNDMEYDLPSSQKGKDKVLEDYYKGTL